MFNADWGYDPFQSNKSPAYWKLDKPTLIGESPAKAGQYTMKQMVDAAFTNGYAGIMPWSYNANDGAGTWSESKGELKAFRDAHAALVDFQCSNETLNKGKKNLPMQRGPFKDPSGTTASVFSLQGKLIWTGHADALQAAWVHLNGTFFFQISDVHDRVVSTGKFVSYQGVR